MKIYTKSGDDGTTALFGGGRVGKDHPRVAAYGAVDEANAALGLGRALLGALAAEARADLDDVLGEVQQVLFVIGAELATPLDSPARQHLTPLADEAVSKLEAAIDRAETELEPLQTFILPAGHPAAAALQVARTVTRRAERQVVALSRDEPVPPLVLAYLNRLADLLFVLARLVNARAGVPEVRWRP